MIFCGSPRWISWLIARKDYNSFEKHCIMVIPWKTSTRGTGPQKQQKIRPLKGKRKVIWNSHDCHRSILQQIMTSFLLGKPPDIDDDCWNTFMFSQTGSNELVCFPFLYHWLLHDIVWMNIFLYFQFWMDSEWFHNFVALPQEHINFVMVIIYYQNLLQNSPKKVKPAKSEESQRVFSFPADKQEKHMETTTFFWRRTKNLGFWHPYGFKPREFVCLEISTA